MQLAQQIKISGMEEPIEGPLPAEFTDLASVVTIALKKLIFPVAGVILFAYLVWGGFDYLTSMGDPKKAEVGKNKITNAIVGFVIIFVAYWIVQIIDYVLGLKIYT